MENLLATKLYIPAVRPELVHRPRLIERLNAGIFSGCKLVLISAPAGFGKTTLVSEWIASRERIESKVGVAWLSLDVGDNDPARFLIYLISALQTLVPSLGEGVLRMLYSPQPLAIEAILTTLVNEITTVPDNISLVLDDYHHIDSKPVNASTSVDEALTFLLEHLPHQLHLVITTREDPPLPLARLRARGHMMELRAADLRFTSSEAAEFINKVMGLNLSAENVAALENRTEGWIAGLQMAALALQSLSAQGRADTDSFIRSFSGSHRFVLDYLVEEVLQSQPEPIRNFLLQTSILDRLSGPLCDAVRFGWNKIPLRQDDGREILETLERANLFVVPLDDQRQWYRYHQLFADVLQTHLMEAQPDQVSTLHQRASAWFEQNSLPPDAIRHALAAKDYQRAANLIELAWSAMDINLQSATWLSWAKALPDKLIRARPVLSVGYAWALLDGGEMEACESWLRDAEQWLDTAANKPAADKRLQPEILSNEMIVVDEEQFRSLPASIAAARAYRALALGDVPGTVKYAQQAIKLTPEEDQLRRTQATALLGLTLYASGDLEAADQALADFQANLLKDDETPTAISITFILADIRMARGRLHEAASVYQQLLQLMPSQGEPMPLGIADLYRGISELYREWGDLETAEEHLLIGQKLGEQAALTDWQHRLYVTQARIKESQGDLDGALNLLDEAKRWYIRGPLPDVRPVAALKARVWLKQGRLAEALGWAREQGLSVGDDISYLCEFEHITLVRLLIARFKNERLNGFIKDAIGLLDRLLQAAEAGCRMGSVIEILVLQALAHQAQNNTPGALAALERALALAEAEGYVRIFVDEGKQMAALLGKLEAEGGKRKMYIHKLLVAFGIEETLPSLSIHHPLVEPLSKRELEVLKLLGTELSGPEIARELIVSLNTIRTHTKNIFNKLGVNNRRAAVRRAQELDLI